MGEFDSKDRATLKELSKDKTTGDGLFDLNEQSEGLSKGQKKRAKSGSDSGAERPITNEEAAQAIGKVLKQKQQQGLLAEVNVSGSDIRVGKPISKEKARIDGVRTHALACVEAPVGIDSTKPGVISIKSEWLTRNANGDVEVRSSCEQSAFESYKTVAQQQRETHGARFGDRRYVDPAMSAKEAPLRETKATEHGDGHSKKGKGGAIAGFVGGGLLIHELMEVILDKKEKEQ